MLKVYEKKIASLIERMDALSEKIEMNKSDLSEPNRDENIKRFTETFFKLRDELVDCYKRYDELVEEKIKVENSF